MQNILPKDLKHQLESNNALYVLDVREDWEYELFNIGGDLMPLGDLMAQVNRIPRDKPVVVVCRKGIRSRIAIQRLEEKYNFTNLVNLEGGLEAFRRLIGD